MKSFKGIQCLDWTNASELRKYNCKGWGKSSMKILMSHQGKTSFFTQIYSKYRSEFGVRSKSGRYNSRCIPELFDEGQRGETLSTTSILLGSPGDKGRLVGLTSLQFILEFMCLVFKKEGEEESEEEDKEGEGDGVGGIEASTRSDKRLWTGDADPTEIAKLFRCLHFLWAPDQLNSLFKSHVKTPPYQRSAARFCSSKLHQDITMSQF